MNDYRTIDTGTTERMFALIERATGDPIVSGQVDYYLKAKSGPNDGEWWDATLGDWAGVETPNAMVHEADGIWEIDLPVSPFSPGLRYVEYAKESLDAHVPGNGRHLLAKDSMTDDSIAVAVQALGLSVTLGPLVASRNPGNLLGAPLSLEMFAAETKTFPLTAYDSQGQPVPLTGKTLRLVVQTLGDAPTGLFQVDMTDIELAGGNDEIALVTVSDSLSDVEPSRYDWRLWDLEAPEVLLHGPFTLFKALKQVA